VKGSALVTGASRGIGRSVAEKLQEDGFNVLTPSRSEMDLAVPASIEAYVAGLTESVDVIVNNAGINIIAETAHVRDDVLEETFQINLLGPIRLVRGLLPGMISNGYGRIVNISSIWSLVAKPGRSVYAGTKSGLNGLTRAMAVELAPHGILVNAVAPGYVATELTRQNNSLAELEKIRAAIPLGRLAEANEIAELVAFLCSKKNSYITGQVIYADGGFTCQ